MIAIPVACSGSGITLDEARVLPDGSIWIYGGCLADDIDTIDVLKSAADQHFRGFEALFAASADRAEDDWPAIRDCPPPAAADHALLYDGTFPPPCAGGTFDDEIATEVIEHTDDLAAIRRAPIEVLHPKETGLRYFFHPFIILSWIVVQIAALERRARSFAAVVVPSIFRKYRVVVPRQDCERLVRASFFDNRLP